jgi:hypothetical protein
MHDIEPYFQWRDHYKVEKDPKSPFFNKEYSEFQFSQKIYNYYIHPQWDFFGSETLYLKILFTDYDQGFAIIEIIGEWNDAIGNDIMFLKREIADLLINEGITKFVVVCENVLNFHASDNCYYEEWAQEVGEDLGWICLLNVRPHVFEEMRDTGIDNHCYVLPDTHMVSWRKFKPQNFVEHLQSLLDNLPKWID